MYPFLELELCKNMFVCAFVVLLVLILRAQHKKRTRISWWVNFLGLTVDEIKQTKPKKVGDGSGFAQFNI